MRKLHKLICLEFNGSELDKSSWKELDDVSAKRLLVAKKDITEHLDADGLLVKLGAKVNKDLIDKLTKLEYIGMLSTGYGGIDTTYAKSKNITVTNIADYATEGVAEFTFGILLEYLRDVSKARQQAKEGNYSDDFTAGEIKGKVFGVVGLGAIGKRTAELARAFGAKVCYWSRKRKPDFEANGFTYTQIDELLANSDIITLNLALNPQTENIINTARINSIKNGAIFINPSPMELLDFNALVQRLSKDDMIFMLDHSDEMTTTQLKALQPLENAIVYPAIAYLTREAGQLKKRIYVDNVKNFLGGKSSNKVN